MREMGWRYWRRAAVLVWLPLAAAASPPAVTDTAQAASLPAAAAPADAAAPAAAPSGTDADAPAADPAAKPASGKPAHVHRHRHVAAATRPHAAASTDATVALTTQPGSELETTATRLVASDLKQSRSAGDPPVMLVGSASLSVQPAPAALFVQVQSADFCGSAGCSTSAYLKHGADWTKVLDSISGPIKVSRRSHHGMYDLLVHGTDRWVWNGSAYADTLPSPDVDLLHSTKK